MVESPDAAGSSQAVLATPSPDHLGQRVVRTPDPWTYDKDRTSSGARAVGGRGANAFRCSTTFTLILYKLFPSTRLLGYSLVTMLTLTNLSFLKRLKVF
jgi:hypothetical protein